MNTYKVTLTEEERDQLTEMTRTGTHAARKIIHALILLNVDCGPHATERQINEEISKVLKIGMRTIDRVKAVCRRRAGRSVKNGSHFPCNMKSWWTETWKPT